MNELYGIDCSEFQSNINWDQLNAAANFVMIRAAYGTIVDPYFLQNQREARRVRASAGPLGIGYYYFGYPTLLDAVTSANYFVSTLGELQAGEVLALDLEGNIGPDPVTWALSFLQTVAEKTGVKPLVYLNQSEVSGYNWQPVYGAGFGLWLADYSGSKTSACPATPWPVVAMRQWTNVDAVAGVPGKVDGDTFYGTFDQFYAYGYEAPESTPQPATVTTAQTTTSALPLAYSGSTAQVPAGSTPVPVRIASAPVAEPAPSSSQPSTEPATVDSSPVSDQSASVSSAPFFSTTAGRFLVGLVGTGITPLIVSLTNFHTNDAGVLTAIAGGVTLLTTLKDLVNDNMKNTPNSKS